MFMALFISYIIYVEYLLNDYRVTLCFPRKTFEFHLYYFYIYMYNNMAVMTPPSHIGTYYYYYFHPTVQ